MKVLFSAFSCGPGRGSEPGIGWNWLVQVSREHEIWLVTTEECREDIMRELPANVHATFLPSFHRWARLKRTGVPGLDWCYYYWWQWKVYRFGRKLHEEIRFDLVHHVTFGSWRAPSFVYLLGPPLIWGPLGGGETIPKKLRRELGLRGRVFESIRDLASFCSKLDPALRATMRKATRILVANKDTMRVIPAAYRQKVQLLMGIGMSGLEKKERIEPTERPKGFLILFAGGLEPRKGGTIALRALARLTRSLPDATLVIIGKGDEAPRLMALAIDLGVTSHVRFLGGLPRSKVLGWMETADVFLLPSLRDSAGFVFLEAMAEGKPVVCLDLGGPGEIVNDDCGIKVHPGEPGQVVEDLVNALKRLADSPELRHLKGEAGRRRVHEDFNWTKKGEQMLGIYLDLTGSRSQTALPGNRPVSKFML